jgi:hypothetical protein
MELLVMVDRGDGDDSIVLIIWAVAVVWCEARDMEDGGIDSIAEIADSLVDDTGSILWCVQR